VSRFQFRTGDHARWRAIPDTASLEVSFEDLTTEDIYVRVRCADGLGRPDGSSPRLNLRVNRAPVLRRTLDDAGQIPSYPLAEGEVSLTDIEAQDGILAVRLRAMDPDSTTDRFVYSIKIKGESGSYSDPQSPEPGDIYYGRVRFRRALEHWASGETDTLEVRIEEDALGESDNRRIVRKIPFRVVD
jgi:hypothetical protein